MKSKIILVLISVCMMMSCSDFLQRNSLEQLSEEDFWKTETDAIYGINAVYYCYREFTNEMSTYGMLDDYSDIAFQSFNSGMMTGVFATNAGFYRIPWGILYKGINRANLAIERIPEIDMDEKTKDRLIGEAKFLRSLFYFKLWDFYNGVPIYDKVVSFSEAYKPRNTSAEVYEFIVKDLTEAIPLLIETYPKADQGRATKWAAISLRGKAHLFAKKWADAAADFKNVMDNSGRILHPQYSELFFEAGEDNKEVIFDVQYIEEAGFGIATDYVYGNPQTQVGGIQRSRPSNFLVNIYEMSDGRPFSWSYFTNANGDPFDPDKVSDWNDEASVRKIFENRDPRLQQSVVVPWSTFLGKDNRSFLYKWPYDASDPYCFRAQFSGVYAWRKFVEIGSKHVLKHNSPGNISIIRLADVMLMYAEAQNEAKGTPDQSVYDAINDVRNRVQMPPIPTGDQSAVRERIRHERKVELAGEGQRYSDIRRWGIAVDVCNHAVKSFDGATVYRNRAFPERYNMWPIPQDEIDLNPSLIQSSLWAN